MAPGGKELSFPARLATTEPEGKASRAAMEWRRTPGLQYLTVVAGIALMTGAAFLITPIVGAHGTALVYLLTVVLLALFVDRGPALLAAALSALCWDYFFIPPLFTLAIHSFEDAMLCAMYFVVALALGQLTSRIEAQRLAEQKARISAESERLSKALLDSMSHELRTPIGAIKTATSALQELGRTGLSDFQRGMLREIREATERLDRLVGNALEINRLESGAVKPRIDDCDPAELAHLCVAETEEKFAGRPLSVQIENDLPMTPIDFVLTQQALVNLLANAAIHTPPGTRVELAVRVEAGALALTVSDEGPGIDAESLPRIFDKFYRGPKAPAGGTGLGLSLVKGFIEAQGGSVHAANRPGGGAIFTIRLPVKARPPAATAPEKERP